MGKLEAPLRRAKQHASSPLEPFRVLCGTRKAANFPHTVSRQQSRLSALS